MGPSTTYSYLAMAASVLLSAVLYVVVAGLLDPNAAGAPGPVGWEPAVALAAVVALLLVSVDSVRRNRRRRVG